MSGLLLGMTPDGEDGTDEWNQADTNQVEERIGGETSFAARLEAAAANQGTGEDEGNQPKRAKSSSDAKCVDGGGAEGQPSVSYFPREWRSTRGEGTGAGHVPVAWKPAEPTPRRDTQTTRRTPVPFRKNTTMANGRKGGDGPSLAIDPSSRDTVPTWKPKADPTSSFAFPSSPAASPMRRERKGSEAMFSPYRRLRPTPSMETRAPTSPGYASWRQATLGRTSLASPRAGTATPIAVTTGKRRRVEDGGNDAHRPPASRLRLGVSAIDTHATPRRMETAGTPIDWQGPASTPSTKRAGFGDISTDTARRILMTLDSLGKTASGTLAPETDAGRPTPVDFSKTFQKLSTPLSKTTTKERPPPVDTLGTLAQDGRGTEQEGKEVRASRERLAAKDHISLRGGKVTEGEKRASGEVERTVPMDRSVEAKPSDDAFPVFTFRSPVPEPELERLANVGASDGIPAPVFAFGTNGTPAATPAGTDQSVPGSPTDIARANAQAAAAAASPLPMVDADDEGEEEGHEEEVPQKGFSTGIRTPTPPRLSTGLDFLKKTAEDAKAAADASAKAGTKPTGPASGGKGLGTDAAKANGDEGVPVSFKWGAPAVDVDEQKGREGEAAAQAKKGGETPTKAGSFFQFGASPAQAPTVGFVFGKTETSFPNIGQKKDPAEKATGDGTAEEKEVREKEDAPVSELSGGWDASFLKKNEEASQAAVNAAKEEINKASGSPPGTSGAAPLFSVAPPKDDADAGATPAPIFVFGQGRAGDQKGLKQDDGQGVAKATLSGFPGGAAGEKQEDAKPASSGFPAFKFAASAPGGFVFGSAPSTNATAGVTENPQDSEAQPTSAAPSTAPTFPTPKAPVSLAVDASTQPTDEEPPSPTFGVGHQPAAFKFGTQGGEDMQRASTESDIPKPSATFTFGASSVNASTAGKAANPFVFGASPTATASPVGGSTPAPPTSGPEPGSRVSTQPTGTVSDQAEANATTRSGGFTFGASAGHPSSGNGGAVPAHETGGIPPPFGAAAAPGAFGGTSSTSAFGGSVGSGAVGAGTGTPAFGGVSAGPAFGAASAASTFGGGAATPIFGGDKGISGAPVFGSSGTAPAFGSVPGTSGFGGASTTPGFGAGASVSAFGGSASAGSFGGAQHAPSFSGAGAPFSNANAPAPASPATGFGAGSSTPSFGGGGAPAFGGGAGSAPGFGTSGSAPTFGASGGAPVFGASGSAPAFGASGSAPAFGTSGSAPAFGASGSAPAFGASGSAPTFGAPSFGASGSTPGFGVPGGAPSFGGGASFPSNNPGSFPAGGGGFSMGSAGQPQPGQRRRIVKARRPARK